jgi:Raf kinase inhibitor-like YbhB/YbcL family protein
MKTMYRMLAAVAAFTLAGAPAVAGAAAFTVTANGFADNALLPADFGFDKMSSDNVHSCGGTNKAPGFTWTGTPANTQSFAILEVDPDGGRGAGINHWVIYNIPGSASSISTAEIASGKYTSGRGTGDLVGYRGPCPPSGDSPHHYILTVYALDAPPSMDAGLDRTGVVAAMKGHVLGATTTIFRFQRP